MSVCGDTLHYDQVERVPPAYSTGDTTVYLFTDALSRTAQAV